MYYFKRLKKVLFLTIAVLLISLSIRGLRKWIGNKSEPIEDKIINENNSVNLNDNGNRQDSIPEIENSEALLVTNIECNSPDNSSNNYYLIGNVPHFYQKDGYPTACESFAAVSVMQYYCMEITLDDFIDYYLPKASMPYYDDGILKGENPWEYFIGDPRSNSGYGCYSTVIEKAMNGFCAGSYEIIRYDNKTLSELTDEYVSNGIPVIIWATIQMKEAYGGDSWLLPNGDMFTFVSPEHALVLVGYDDNSYYFSDSCDERKVVAYNRKACENAFEALGNQSIVVLPSQN